MSRQVKAGIVLAVMAATLLVAGYTSGIAQEPTSAGASLMRVLEGNYRVTLDFVLPDKATRTDRVEQVKRIEFHPEYIVIFEQGDAGMIVPVQSIGQLRWDPT